MSKTYDMPSIEEVTKLWNELGNIPVDDDGIIEEPFLHFPVGTDREDIWLWIEDTYNVSVHSLMFKQQKLTTMFKIKVFVPKGNVLAFSDLAEIYECSSFKRYAEQKEGGILYNLEGKDYYVKDFLQACIDRKIKYELVNQ